MSEKRRETAKTVVRYVGHHIYDWAKRDTMGGLLEMLRSHPLDPRFWLLFRQNHPSDVSCYCYTGPEYPGACSFCGNFFDWSCAFNIVSSDPEVCAELQQAITENIKSQGFRDALQQCIDGIHADYLREQAKLQEYKAAGLRRRIMEDQAKLRQLEAAGVR
ncbi:MAG: hypothetical protein PHF64_00305 [Methanoregula sp.]|nr:hypothetical protein [Methanoregula sp.]